MSKTTSELNKNADQAPVPVSGSTIKVQIPIRVGANGHFISSSDYHTLQENITDLFEGDWEDGGKSELLILEAEVPLPCVRRIQARARSSKATGHRLG